MSEHLQVQCPNDGTQQVVELEGGSEGALRVAWCSRGLGCPDCDQKCLKSLGQVAHIMISDPPTFSRAELSTLPIDRAVERFETVPVDRLPVLDGERLIGAISLKKLALWKDSRQTEASLRLAEWDSSEGSPPLSSCLDERPLVLEPETSLTEAIDALLASHVNEGFVADKGGVFLGLIYARQLLRILRP